MRPSQVSTSYFELKRRSEKGDKDAAWHLHREQRLGDIISLQRVITAVLLVLTAVMAIVALGWLWGIITAVLVALFYGRLAHLALIERLASRLYAALEPKLLKLITRYPRIAASLRSVVLESEDFHQIESREELEHLVEKSSGILTTEQKQLIVHSLKFDDTAVKDIMTPKSVIDSVKDGEFLGPMVLSELHKLGHSRLPVINGDIDHVVGMLYIQDLLTLDNKRSVTAEKAMEPKVFYIRQDQTLQYALAAFLKTRHHLFIVINEYRETVGLLTLEDVIEALLGRKIVDEFDAHDDLRAVAERNLADNNIPPKHADV
jgi:CBS domain containing-hemolysin-like protein